MSEILKYIEGLNWRTYHETVEAFIQHYKAIYGLYHAGMSDTPYNLDSIEKRFGSQSSKPVKPTGDGYFERSSIGFMRQKWDSNVAHRAETWEGLRQFYHPGAFFVQSHSQRKLEKLLPALVDGGWQIMSGFTNYTTGATERVPLQFEWIKGDSKGKGQKVSVDDEDWSGYQYGGNALKPQHEDIIIARNPIPKNTSDRDNVIATGAGGLNFDLAREAISGNRLPGTVILSHHPECKRIGFELEGSKGDIYALEKIDVTDFDKSKYKFLYHCHEDCHILAMGDKAEFFAQVDSYYEQVHWSDIVAKNLAEANPTFYHGSVSGTERNLGCEDLPTQTRQRVNAGNGLHNDPKFAPTYHHHNHHPTLKPIALWQYIARLLLPPKRYNPQLLVPFAGTGSEMIGGLYAGFLRVVGIEMNDEYIPINQARLTYFSERINELDYYKTFTLSKTSFKRKSKGNVRLFEG